jgi:hypothetical protein
VLRERRFALPLQFLEPIDLAGDGSVCVPLLNPTGGRAGRRSPPHAHRDRRRTPRCA